MPMLTSLALPLAKSPAATFNHLHTCSLVLTREESQRWPLEAGESIKTITAQIIYSIKLPNLPIPSRIQASSWEWDVTASKSKSNQKPYKCIICCRPFKHEASMQLHRQRAHSIVRKLKCLKCDQTFETMHNLKVHTMTMHKKASEESSCGSSFRLEGRFKVC